MSFGLTPQGFIPKRLNDIVPEYETFFKSIFGTNANLLPSSKLGQLVGILSERESELWALAEAVYNSQYPLKSSSAQLDNVISLTGLKRLGGLKSQITLTFLGTVGTIIPSGSVFSVLGNSLSRYVLQNSQTIISGQNEIQKINFDLVPDSGTFVLSLDGINTISLSFNSTSQDVENALNALSNLSSVVVAGDFSVGFTVTFQGVDGLKDYNMINTSSNLLLNGVTAVVVSFAENQKGIPNQIEALVIAESEGVISAPSGSITVIENPITGLDSVLNKLDATTGRDIETDADLKIRREQTLQTAGASVLGAIASQLASLSSVVAVIGFENITMINDADGRPPKSYEMVVQGGLDSEIAQKIWDTKSAGIETFGSVSDIAIDTEGFNHTMNFSRPLNVNIFLTLDVSVDVNFPADGVTQITNSILSYGKALLIGENVIVYPKMISSLNNISGITDIVTKIGKLINPTLDDNVIIASNEISSWDSSRITVNIL